VLHVNPHWSTVHVARAFVTAPQVLPHDPQLSGSSTTRMQVEPQRVKPLAHWKSHMPPAQVAVALDGAEQA
jgi:hypothetical protein